MTDVNAYFDARIGVGQNEWQNQTGGINFQLFNPIISKEGIEVVGNNTSYGKFSKPYTSGSSRTWYFVFKNTSGKYSDWKTIIGNESGTYTCSTIAMDGNGYIKFTRPDIIPRTSLGLRCSDWHVVAWVSNGSNRTTKMWIDGTYIGSVVNMQGWADDTYLCRGSSWWYGDNNTVFRAVAIADSAHSDADVVTNSNWLRQSYVSNYIADLYEKKCLVRNETGIYSVINGELELLEETVLSAELFQTYGVYAITDWSLISSLVNPEIVCWCSRSDVIPKINVSMKAVPKDNQQNVITDAISLTHSSIKGIESATLNCEGNIVFAVSFDDKQTWKVWNGTEWSTISEEFSGMTKELFEAITYDKWLLLFEGASSFYIRASLLDATAKLTQIYIDFAN